MNTLDARLLAAHAAEDTNALITLYAEAADASETPEAAAFYLTQAYVYALEQGHDQAAVLRLRLIAMGREEPFQL